MKKQRVFQSSICIKKSLMALLIALGLILSVSSLNAQEQRIKVKGTVKDVLGEAVIGASVFDKSSGIGSTTDFDGHFNLEVSPK